MGLNNYKRLFNSYKNYMNLTVRNFLDSDLDYELLFLRMVSPYVEQNYTMEGFKHSLRLSAFLLAGGSDGKGHLMKEEINLLRDFQLQKTKFNYYELKGKTTDANLRGTVQKVKTKKTKEDGSVIYDKDGSIKTIEENDYVPGIFQNYSHIYISEATDLLDDKWNSTGRASLILNGSEDNDMEIGIAGTDKKTECNFSFFMGSVPRITVNKEWTNKNILGRFIMLFANESINRNLNDMLSFLEEDNWTRGNDSEINEIKDSLIDELHNLFNNAEKVNIKYSINNRKNKKHFFNKCKIEKYMEGISTNSSDEEVEIMKGVIKRLYERHYHTLALIICVLNGDKEIKDKHLERAGILCWKWAFHLKNYYFRFIKMNTLNETKNKYTDKNIIEEVLGIIRKYYNTTYEKNKEYLNKKTLINLINKRRKTTKKGEILPSNRNEVFKLINQMVKDDVIKILKGEKNIKYICLKE